MFYVWDFDNAFVWAWLLSVIIGIIEYTIMDRKIIFTPWYEIEINTVEKWAWGSIMVIGIIVVFLPYTEIFQKYLYANSLPARLLISKVLYLIWGLEFAIMNKYTFYKLIMLCNSEKTTRTDGSFGRFGTKEGVTKRKTGMK
jgi:hypothetical protein